MMTTRYEINDVLSVETNIDLPIPSYYAAEISSRQADILFTATTDGNFTPGDPTHRIGSRYRWEAETATLHLDWNVPLDLRCKVTGLGDIERQTVVEMTDQYRRRGETGSLFTSVLSVELLARGYTILHGGCLSREEGGALISGWDDMGKTSTCLSMHGRAAYSFMGDDAVILGSSGDAHAWDVQVGISPYTATGNIPIPDGKRRRIKLKRLAKHIPGLGILHSSRERVDVGSLIEQGRTQCSPSHVFFLEGGNSEPKEIADDEAARRMLETSNADKKMIKHDLVRTYAYLYPPISNPYEKRRRVFEKSLEGLAPVELRAERKDEYPEWITAYGN